MSTGFRHDPVLAREVVALLRPAPGAVVLDGTLGGGGHSELLLQEGARVRFTLPGDEGQVPEVIAQIAAAGGRVVSVAPVHETLEDVFLREVRRP